MKNNFQPELIVDEWLKRILDDELHAQSLLKHKDAPASGACFVSQQMAEKCFKAFLVFKKKWYPKIHPTDKLWKFCQELDSSFNSVKKEAVFLTGFYTATRYPGDLLEFSWQDAKKAFAAAQKIKKLVLKKVKHK